MSGDDKCEKYRGTLDPTDRVTSTIQQIVTQSQKSACFLLNLHVLMRASPPSLDSGDFSLATPINVVVVKISRDAGHRIPKNNQKQFNQ